MEQTPIFIPLNEIASIDYPETTPYRSGLVEIKPKGHQLNGYVCDLLTAEYMWDSNGPCKGFFQALPCRFVGRPSHFNHLLRALQNNRSSFIILLPKGEFYTVVGWHFGDIVVNTSSTHDHLFMLTCDYALVPFPYYDGAVNIHDCDMAELTDRLYKWVEEEETDEQ